MSSLQAIMYFICILNEPQKPHDFYFRHMSQLGCESSRTTCQSGPIRWLIRETQTGISDKTERS